MNAEKRYRFYASIYTYLVTWYTFCLLAYQIYELPSDAEKFLSGELQIVLTLFIFTFSLVINRNSFIERAEEYRRCYLELDELYALRPDDIEAQYHNILARYPNHLPVDYGWFVTKKHLLYQDILEDSYKNHVKVTFWSHTWVLIRVALRHILPVILFVLPIAVFSYSFSTAS